ncbi:MAG: DUF6624 domain-containing protein [Bacteroidia bacterium]
MNLKHGKPIILSKIILLLLAFFIPLLSYSQKINRMKHMERQGKWIIYRDSTKQIYQTGRYKNGDPKGLWKFYDEAGNLSKTELYRSKKIKFKFYYPNGTIKKRGKAKTVLEEKNLHFYYYGTWYNYDSTGVLTKKQVYDYGSKILETSYVINKTKINSSLVIFLNELNNKIYKYIDSIHIAEASFGKASMQYQRAFSLNNLYSSKLLSDLDSVIAIYGYPGKTLVGDDYAIAFSIISSASLDYKEKYYDLIIDAANAAELEWQDVAYFVDKVKVAKKEKQVYGTRFKLDDISNKTYYYPIEDMEHLNERRKKVGLKDMDTSKLEFINY